MTQQPQTDTYCADWPHGYLLKFKDGREFDAQYMGHIPDPRALFPCVWVIGDSIYQATLGGEVKGLQGAHILRKPDPAADDGTALWMARKARSYLARLEDEEVVDRALKTLIERLEAE